MCKNHDDIDDGNNHRDAGTAKSLSTGKRNYPSGLEKQKVAENRDHESN